MDVSSPDEALILRTNDYTVGQAPNHANLSTAADLDEIRRKRNLGEVPNQNDIQGAVKITPGVITVGGGRGQGASTQFGTAKGGIGTGASYESGGWGPWSHKKMKTGDGKGGEGTGVGVISGDGEAGQIQHGGDRGYCCNCM
jgi:hypothetical protein